MPDIKLDGVIRLDQNFRLVVSSLSHRSPQVELLEFNLFARVFAWSLHSILVHVETSLVHSASRSAVVRVSSLEGVSTCHNKKLFNSHLFFVIFASLTYSQRYIRTQSEAPARGAAESGAPQRDDQRTGCEGGASLSKMVRGSGMGILTDVTRWDDSRRTDT